MYFDFILRGKVFHVFSTICLFFAILFLLHCQWTFEYHTCTLREEFISNLYTYLNYDDFKWNLGDLCHFLFPGFLKKYSSSPHLPINCCTSLVLAVLHAPLPMVTLNFQKFSCDSFDNFKTWTLIRTTVNWHDNTYKPIIYLYNWIVLRFISNELL